MFPAGFATAMAGVLRYCGTVELSAVSPGCTLCRRRWWIRTIEGGSGGGVVMEPRSPHQCASEMTVVPCDKGLKLTQASRLASRGGGGGPCCSGKLG